MNGVLEWRNPLLCSWVVLPFIHPKAFTNMKNAQWWPDRPKPVYNRQGILIQVAYRRKKWNTTWNILRIFSGMRVKSKFKRPWPLRIKLRWREDFGLQIICAFVHNERQDPFSVIQSDELKSGWLYTCWWRRATWNSFAVLAIVDHEFGKFGSGCLKQYVRYC